ncbi:SOS response-associated peptidase family protein [Phenylobacterium sp.]|uniref:SOS response-associated peptidase n=1 Tax=Phenylobacterium sp. TaxID=1871053 RepID=UPI00121CE75C|nr:SOS response-associated peptidase family protein [Phenylobacterium sp.]THD62733.1 MAG: SOS response-associated peptidase [Phenylobacterium sp.]
MCNEFRNRQPLDTLVEEFSKLTLPIHWAGGAPNPEPRDSIRPADPAPILVGAPGGVELKQLRWGFPNPHKGGPIINFRSDGRRFPAGRCLVPADGFYEFTGSRPPKSKWLFTAADAELFCIAGLVRDDRLTLLTMPPGPDIADFHDRQIVILPRGQWAQWLDTSQPQPVFQPLPAGSLNVVRIR